MHRQEIFKSIFGNQWGSLPPVMHKHYANRGYSSDRVRVDGYMNIDVSILAKLLSPLLRGIGALAPIAGSQISVTVYFDSELTSDAFCFDRIFYFPNRRPYHFRSRMIPNGGNEVVEFMPGGIGWHAAFEFDGQKITLKHLGYKIKLAGRIFRLPLELILGRGSAEEYPINDNSFRMSMEIRHPIFGKFYGYDGTFKITEVTFNE